MHAAEAARRLLSVCLITLVVASCSLGRPLSPTPRLAPSIPATVASTPASQAVTIGLPADDGARIIAVESPPLYGAVPVTRARDLTIDSPAVGVVKVRLLLPRTFDTEPTTTWPVLYLLHGGGGLTYSDWTEHSDVEAMTAATDLLVVMPEADSGWYSDWWNRGQGGPPMWETFHLVELSQLLERNWHAGEERAIAGESMGGYGAMEYAARRPGVFRLAASYSGALDPLNGTVPPFLIGNLWGDPIKNVDVWKAHDPTVNAGALRGTRLFVAYGDGIPGPLDDGHASLGDPTGELEAWVARQSAAFTERLAGLAIPVTIEAYGDGTHSPTYFERDLHESFPQILDALGL